ncbi:N-6 DNA methylase [Pseudoalteromonas sp. MMG022]|uniref:HsdM family class I SAM-dependent methyltransferase n=1 Tax=Pseudoalteromonas sp. MMG022 TaxID=2909978 RepID=UPI001F342933|nr:N-6 DNA methylase [Pseudoalteromonas sp. MMG022]MCF6437185.1 SAM-dependent methyltransferase [Pseudoalteromonas sp. MMG022]
MENLRKELWNTMEQCRGLMEVRHLIELFTYIAFIAKESPEAFKVIVNSGQAKQLEILSNTGADLKEKYPLAVCSVPDYYRIDSRVISIAVNFMDKAPDFKSLAKSLREFVKETGKYTLELSSNLNMERIFLSLIGDCSGKSVYDGACGLARVASNLNPEKLYLEEKYQSTWVSAYRLLTLEEKNFELKNCDSLLASEFGYQEQFDIVLMEPPFAQRFGTDERHRLAESRMIKVAAGKAVSASAGDSLWIQQVLSNLNTNGKGFVLLPQGVLFRGGYDAKVREYLLAHELLEAVIGLPENILDGTSISPAILVLNKNKAAGAPIIFVDASNVGTSSRKGVEITESDAQLISNLASGKLQDDSRFRAVLNPEISSNNNELTIARYIKKNINIKEVVLNDELKKLAECKAKFESSQENLMRLISQFS